MKTLLLHLLLLVLVSCGNESAQVQQLPISNTTLSNNQGYTTSSAQVECSEQFIKDFNYAAQWCSDLNYIDQNNQSSYYWSMLQESASQCESDLREFESRYGQFNCWANSGSSAIDINNAIIQAQIDWMRQLFY